VLGVQTTWDSHGRLDELRLRLVLLIGDSSCSLLGASLFPLTTLGSSFYLFHPLSLSFLAFSNDIAFSRIEHDPTPAMEHQQQHHQHIPDDQNSNMSGAPYGFYQPDHDQSYGMPYGQQQLQPYQQVMHHPGAPPRGSRMSLLLRTHVDLITSFHN
jgi:hypothetical protein